MYWTHNARRHAHICHSKHTHEYIKYNPRPTYSHTHTHIIIYSHMHICQPRPCIFTLQNTENASTQLLLPDSQMPTTCSHFPPPSANHEAHAHTHTHTQPGSAPSTSRPSEGIFSLSLCLIRPCSRGQAVANNRYWLVQRGMSKVQPLDLQMRPGVTRTANTSPRTRLKEKAF